MPTLLLTARQTEDAQELWRACIQSGWTCHRVHGWKVPDANPSDVAIYAEPLLATHIANTLKLKLLEPPNNWLATLDLQWRGRSVNFTTLNSARQLEAQQFIKSAAGKEFEAKIYSSGAALPGVDQLDGNLPVLVQDVVSWEVEYRCFVLNNQVRTASSYWRHGHSARDQDGRWSEDESEQAIQFCDRFLRSNPAGILGACVIDVGVIRGSGWAVIESNAAWSSGIYGCSGVEVLEVLKHACSPNLS